MQSLLGLGGGRVVEVGTGLGFSTLFLAHACKEAGCRLVAIEVRDDRARRVEKELSDLGLLNHVEFVVGDAKSVDLGLRDVVMAFIDGAKSEYHAYLESIERFLAPRALVVAHNTLSHPHHVAKYLELVYGAGFRSITVATDPAGITFSLYLGERRA